MSLNNYRLTPFKIPRLPGDTPLVWTEGRQGLTDESQRACDVSRTPEWRQRWGMILKTTRGDTAVPLYFYTPVSDLDPSPASDKYILYNIYSGYRLYS